MVTEAMEQEHHHDHDEEEDTTEDTIGATVILGKGKCLPCICLDWSSFWCFCQLTNCWGVCILKSKLALSQELPEACGSCGFITLFTKACHCTLSWIRWILYVISGFHHSQIVVLAFLGVTSILGDYLHPGDGTDRPSQNVGLQPKNDAA